MKSTLHIFDRLVATAPDRLNDPFDYSPDPLVLEAQRQLLVAVEQLDGEVIAELSRGKMMGVMVVRSRGGEVGYLMGFSGIVAGRLSLDGFIPPIDGRGDDDEVLALGDREIGELGGRIAEINSSAEYRECREAQAVAKARLSERQQQLDSEYRAAKQQREERREAGEADDLLRRESQRQKGDHRRELAELRGVLAECDAELATIQCELQALEQQRRELSNSIQRQLFDRYRVVNGDGEWRSLLSIFEESVGRMPPSGAGECAAPKMLHYALTHDLVPLSIGEFWYGECPRGELRRNGEFYGACMGRCYPILNYMLQGVDVERREARSEEDKLVLIHEGADYLVYDKPSGMLTVDGRRGEGSLEALARGRYEWARVAHRLDQDTSGLVIVARSLDSYVALQRAFAGREVTKRYVAIVEGHVECDRGEIDLPLSADFEDRPRQKVDYEGGKPSHTTYEVLERGDRVTRLALYPHTGRTHQLRVHCASNDGLSASIVGDRLYGGGKASGERLMLHAEYIKFRDPRSGELVEYQSTLALIL